MRIVLPLLIAAALAGCHRAAPKQTRLDALDEQLVGNAGNIADPGMATALSNRNAVQPTPASTPAPAPTPAASQPTTIDPHATITRCAGSLDHATGWAGRLPAGIAVYPGAAITEAAGTNADGCALRVVSFTTTAPGADVAAWYRTHATGLSVEDRAASGRHTLTGDAPDRAFILYLEPRRGGGTAADLIVDGGR